MRPYLVAAIIAIGLPTVYLAVRYREYRKFLAGAFFVSSGMQFYFYLANIPIPLMWTDAIQSPQLSLVRGAIHLVLFSRLSAFRVVLPQATHCLGCLGRRRTGIRRSCQTRMAGAAPWRLRGDRR
jgi:hypothetical protein